jgi:hypothetical protein
MRIPRSGSPVLRIFGYIIFAYGAISTFLYIFYQVRYSTDPDMGIVLGNGAIILAGLVALSAATCLRNLEQRLDRLENSRAPPVEGDRSGRPHTPR